MAALTDEDLERMAMEELLRESKRNAERAKEFGSLGWQNPGKSTNKRFLSNMLVSTLRNPLQKSRFNNERQSSNSDSSNERKKRRRSQEDRQRKSSERYSKSYQDVREKNSSESSYRRNNARERYDPHSRRFSGNWQLYEDHSRKYGKGNKINHTANGRSTFQRGGSLGEEEDIYHEDYMEYIQNYKKHMNYYEKMEECMQEKYKRSYHSEERRSPDNEAKMEEKGKSEKLKKASKTKKKRSWSDSNEFSGSDFSECEKKSKTRNHSQSPMRKKRSKHKRKGSRDNESKTKKKQKNSVVNEISDSGDVNSPEGTVSAGSGLDSEAISGGSEEQKGNNSELSNTISGQEGKKSHKKQSKHKKHKHKKHKKR